MLPRLIALTVVLASILGGCNTGSTTIEDMQRNQRMQMMTAG